jgi:hypothetical protein
MLEESIYSMKVLLYSILVETLTGRGLANIPSVGDWQTYLL